MLSGVVRQIVSDSTGVIQFELYYGGELLRTSVALMWYCKASQESISVLIHGTSRVNGE